MKPQDVRNIRIFVGPNPVGWAYTYAYKCPLGPLYTIPTYPLIMVGQDNQGKTHVEVFEVIRFGVSCNNNEKIPKVVGYNNGEAVETELGYWLPEFGTQPDSRLEQPGAWKIAGNVTIHDGPDNPQSPALCHLYASDECIEICGPRAWDRFNQKLIEL